MQHRSAGHQQLEMRAGRQQVRQEAGRRQQVLQVIEDQQHSPEPAAASGPDIFEIAGARTVLLTALARMQSQCKLSGRTEVWGVFYHRVLRPLLTHAKELDYDALVCKYHLNSAEQASNILMTAKRHITRER
jgi:hypothetical protein